MAVIGRTESSERLTSPGGDADVVHRRNRPEEQLHVLVRRVAVCGLPARLVICAWPGGDTVPGLAASSPATWWCVVRLRALGDAASFISVSVGSRYLWPAGRPGRPRCAQRPSRSSVRRGTAATTVAPLASTSRNGCRRAMSTLTSGVFSEHISRRVGVCASWLAPSPCHRAVSALPAARSRCSSPPPYRRRCCWSARVQWSAWCQTPPSYGRNRSTSFWCDGVAVAIDLVVALRSALGRQLRPVA